MGTIRSDAFTVGLLNADSFLKGDVLGIEIAQPLRVSHARANLALPVALDAAGTIYWSDSRVDLAPTGREIDVQIAYRAPLAGLTGEPLPGVLQGFAMTRTAPGHNQAAAADYAAGLRWTASF